MRAAPFRIDEFVGLGLTGESQRRDRNAALDGYVVDERFARSHVVICSCEYVLAVRDLPGSGPLVAQVGRQAPHRAEHQLDYRLRSLGRTSPGPLSKPQQLIPVQVRQLRPIADGKLYRVTSPRTNGLATPKLADALENVFENFARAQGFSPSRPLTIHFVRGFASGSPGHDEGRAIDIDAVGGKHLLKWKKEWDQAMKTAEAIADIQAKGSAIAAEKKRNLGYNLYIALLEHGGWRAEQDVWRPYRGVMQLFGPWTPTEGPWRPMHIENPSAYQRQRLADQQWVYRAHQDHIHVAR